MLTPSSFLSSLFIIHDSTERCSDCGDLVHEVSKEYRAQKNKVKNIEQYTYLNSFSNFDGS